MNSSENIPNENNIGWSAERLVAAGSLMAIGVMAVSIAAELVTDNDVYGKAGVAAGLLALGGSAVSQRIGERRGSVADRNLD